MIYLKKVSTTKPISGNIINSKNITDKEKNTYSADIIDVLLSEIGISETAIHTIINTAKLAAHPIGSYYWSDDPTDPSELFGGTWERVKNRFVYALGDEGNVGDIGGSEIHTLTVDEMPSHTHIQNAHTHTQNAHTHAGMYWHGIQGTLDSGSVSGEFVFDHTWTNTANTGNNLSTGATTATNQSTTATNQNTGGGAAHNNMPPYVKAYCWKRIDPNAKKMISFTISGTSYQAEEGMTWEQWVNSSYNTNSYIIDSDGDIRKETMTYIAYNGVACRGNNVIVSNGSYTTESAGPT